MPGKAPSKPMGKRWFVVFGCLLAILALLVLAGRSPLGPEPGRSHDDPGRFGVSLAASAVSGWHASDLPHLIIRCQQHRTDVYVVTGVSAQPEPGPIGKHTVRLRFDDRQQEREVWDQSADYKALFSQDPIRFVRSIARSRTLTFEFTPFQAGPAVATFSVAGFDKRLPALRRCADRRPSPLS
jgi:hypothetical protein